MSLLICVSILIGNPPTVTHELYKKLSVVLSSYEATNHNAIKFIPPCNACPMPHPDPSLFPRDFYKITQGF